MKIGTIARAGAALFLIGVAVSHLQGQGGVKIPMSNSVSYRTVKIDGLSIFYREAGPKDGPTILLLHGLPSSSRMFEPLIVQDAVAHNEGLGEAWKTRRTFWADRAANESALRTNLLS